MALDRDRFVYPVDDNLICTICHGVLTDPRQCPNEHLFCFSCVSTNFRFNPTKPCSICNIECPIHRITVVPRVVKNILGNLLVRCEYAKHGCKVTWKYEQADSHSSRCPLMYGPVLDMSVKNSMAFDSIGLRKDDMMDLPTYTSMTNRINELAAQLAAAQKAMIDQGDDDDVMIIGVVNKSA